MEKSFDKWNEIKKQVDIKEIKLEKITSYITIGPRISARSSEA